MPEWKEHITGRLASLKLTPPREAEIVEELAQHLEERYQALLAGGATELQARQATLEEIRDRKAFVQELRGVERSVSGERVFLGTTARGNTLGDLGQDIGYGLRMLAKNPGFALIAIVALALGIGANTAIFSVVNAVLLRPLPYQDPSRLVYVWSAEKARGINQSTVSIPDFRDWQQQNLVFDGMTALSANTFNLSGGDEPLQASGWIVAPNFFKVLGVRPQLGRTFAPDEEQWGKHQVVVLSHALWAKSFGRNVAILGRKVILDAEPFTVIGVMPAKFSAPYPEVQLWVPMSFPPGIAIGRDNRFLRVITRLAPGVTSERAQADTDTIARRLEQDHKEDQGVTAYLVPAERQIVGPVRPALLVLLVAVGCVLLIACTNLANLLLVRSAARQKELAIRMALGASRSRLIRQLLTESLLVALFGGALGLLLAGWGMASLRILAAREIPCVQDVGLNADVLSFTLALSVLTGVAFGLIPALQSSKSQVNQPLKEGGRSAEPGMHARRVRDVLVVLQTALALVLLVGAGLLLNSFRRLTSINAGFNPDNVLTCEISLPSSKYKNPQIVSFFQRLLEGVRALHGVKAAGATMTLPLRARGGYWAGLNIEGRSEPATRESRPIVNFVQVTPGYFTALGIPILKGRLFSDQDNSVEGSKVAIINAVLARRFFSDVDPIGKRIRLGSEAPLGPWLNVVGVVGDAALESLNDPRFPQVYSPHAQAEEGGVAGNMALVVRTSSDPLSLAAAVREQVHALDKDQSVANIETLEQVVSGSLAQPRLNTLLLAGFAGFALLLAVIGLYGVLSYSVAQRTHEIGVRMALGARPHDVFWSVLGHALSLTSAGVAGGLTAAFGLTRLMASLLFGIRPTDPATFVAVSVVLTVVALLASYIPARRATKVDPLVALRYE